MAQEPLSSNEDLVPELAGESASFAAETVDSRDIFRALLHEEIRQGRLSKPRRHALIQYANHLNLSPEELGELVADCRRRILENGDPDECRHALRMVWPPEETKLPGSASIVGYFALRGLTVAMLALAGILLGFWIARYLSSQ